MPGKIHIATVHWPDNKWIGIQQYYIQKNISEDFNLYTVVTADADIGTANFDYLHRSGRRDHSEHLNHLLKKVLDKAESDEDVLLFLDGDAFPVAPLDKYLRKSLSEFSLCAIQRMENCGEFIPHPAFCAARIKLWRRLGEAWGRAENNSQFGNDPGGKLYEHLRNKGIEWGKIRRSNRKNLHPLFFGIYDNVVYHHGAGFREPVSRIEISGPELKRKRRKLLSRLAELLPNKYFLSVKRKISPYRKAEYKMISENRQLQKEVFNQIISNREFYRTFT